jgi:hypothetical protein
MHPIILSKSDAERVTQRSTLADGSLCFRTSKFTEVVTWLAPGRVLVTGIGYNDGRSAPLVTTELTRGFPQDGKLIAYANFSAQTGQASVSREWWEKWVKENIDHLERTNMLVRSRMMYMAISVLGMVVGSTGIKVYSEVATFEAVIAKDLPGFRHLPTFPDLPPMLP